MRCQWLLSIDRMCGKKAVKTIGSGDGALLVCREHLRQWRGKAEPPREVSPPDVLELHAQITKR